MALASAHISVEHKGAKGNTSTQPKGMKYSLKFGLVMGILGFAVIATLAQWLWSGSRFPQLIGLTFALGVIAVGTASYWLLVRLNRPQMGIGAMLLFALLGNSLIPLFAPSLLPLGTAAAVVITLTGYSLLGLKKGIWVVMACVIALALDSLFAQTFSSSLVGNGLEQEFVQSRIPVFINISAILGLILVSRQIVIGYEMMLSEEHAILRMLIDNLPDNIFVKDRNSRIVMDNAAHARLLGNSTPDDVIGKNDFDFFPHELAEKYFDDEQRMIESGESKINIEEPTVDPQGNRRCLLTTKVLVRDASNEVIGIVGINRDITALKEAENERDNLLSIEREQRSNLELLITEIQEAVVRLNESAAKILDAATHQASSMVEQEAAIAETMATVEELRVTVTHTAEHARDVASSARNSVDVSRNGEEAVTHTIAGMSSVKQKVVNIAENILALSERSQQIDEIIDTVNVLAEQSKLLALNASIEAARAGAEGRGFAIVAMEVRQLAEESRAATARIRTILKEIQQATNTAVMVTEEGSKEAERGVSLVERAGTAIRDLETTIEGAAQSASQIASSTHQQTIGMEQLSIAMSNIRVSTEQTVAGTRQMEHSVQDLMAMAKQLETAADQYRL